MIILTVEEVLELHKMLVATTGGAAGVRDIGLLESAVMGCHQTFDGVMLYPTVIEKAAQIAFAICKNHPFVDGNKRAAVTAMGVMLDMNNIAISFSQAELIHLGLGLADGSLGYNDILQWIESHQVE